MEKSARIDKGNGRNLVVEDVTLDIWYVPHVT